MKGYVLAIVLVVILAIMSIMSSGCADSGADARHDTGCIVTSDTTSVCDGEEFKLYY